MKKSLLLLMALAATQGIAYGQAEDEASLKTYQAEEVVVTASKLPQTPGNVTQKIEIINAAQFDQRLSGKANLAELLSYSPGSFAAVLSRNDANWGSSGGLAHTYKGFLLDGLPIDAFVDLQSLDPAAFARVEDQRGSASVLYPTYLFMDFAGNQSPLAGTANFVLKERVAQPLTAAGTYYGSYNTRGIRAYSQRAAGNLHFFFGGQREASDYTNYGTPGSWLNMIDDPQYEKTKLYLKGTYFLGGHADHRISFYTHRTWHQGDVGRPNRDYAHTYTTINAAYYRNLGQRLSGQLKVGYRDYDRSWEEDHYPASLALREEDGMEQQILPADLSFSLRHGTGDLLTAGADYQSASYRTLAETDSLRLGNDADATQLGLYVQEEQTLGRLILRAGARLSQVEHDIALLQGAPPGSSGESWTKVLWSAGGRYNHSATLSFYANAGTSFKAPSLKSVGGTIPLADRGVAGRNGQLPNPDLDPESGLSLDLGANFLPNENLILGLRAFAITIDDQIVTEVVSQNPSQSRDINAAKTSTSGLELEARHRLSSGFQWFANLTLTNSEVDNPLDPDQDGTEVNFVPAQTANLGVDLSLPAQIRASLALQYASGVYDSISKAGRRKFDSHAVLNAHLEREIASKDGYRVRLYLDPYNLTDNDYEMPWQFKDPGFAVTGGLALSF